MTLKKLAKKYISLKKEYENFINDLEENPEQGISLGNNCYKIRIAIASKGKGKSGGARIITHIIIRENTVFLLTIYDKSEKENISDKELNELLDQISE
ncbi:type II toxin-antitoxin system RelE/ParE family toxin [Mucilaginibacter sp.]|uniref:type II toxin-antitoxin system RelE/ParE family toxin n=1 Tax=Mucilaginibacter sp. TaxID=1882438 RepID=UPI00345D9F4C